jgi:hypothetical protein
MQWFGISDPVSPVWVPSLIEMDDATGTPRPRPQYYVYLMWRPAAARAMRILSRPVRSVSGVLPRVIEFVEAAAALAKSNGAREPWDRVSSTDPGGPGTARTAMFRYMCSGSM